MPRIDLVPFDDLPPDCRALIEEGEAAGYINSRMYLLALATDETVLRRKLHEVKDRWRSGLIEPRLQELIRLRSAQLLGCDPCATSRKEQDLISEDEVACLVEPRPTGLSARETIAVRFFEKLAVDHYSIDDSVYRELAEHFTAAEVVDLGEYCAWLIGGHRWAHTLDLFGTATPIVRSARGLAHATSSPLE